MKTSFEDSENSSNIGAKLPKLEISKFQGTFLDWNQFETEIDKAKLTQVAKFSYLKELLVPNVRASVDGLPFTTEGYERAKHILKTKYGKSSEVANAYMQCIIGLSTIHGVDPAKIHEFHEKLTSHIQVLETMGKVKEIGGFVRNPIPSTDQMPRAPEGDYSHRDPSIRSPPNRGRLSMARGPSIHQIITLETAIHQGKILPTKPRMKVRRWHVSVSIAMVKIIALQSVGSSLASPSVAGF